MIVHVHVKMSEDDMFYSTKLDIIITIVLHMQVHLLFLQEILALYLCFLCP